MILATHMPKERHLNRRTAPQQPGNREDFGRADLSLAALGACTAAEGNGLTNQCMHEWIFTLPIFYWFVMLPQLNSRELQLQPTQKCLLQGTADLQQAITHLKSGGYPMYRPCIDHFLNCCGCSRVNDDPHSSDVVPRCNRKVICSRSPTSYGALSKMVSTYSVEIFFVFVIAT